MNDAAIDPIVEHVDAGHDVRIEGAAASARLETAAAALEARFNVVRVSAPTGGLSLSALIAQLSGQDKFDEHDDGALERGFRRLCGADEPGRRTVLLLDARNGVQRPVLRYLQQAGRSAPGLVMVIATCPEMENFLAAPDMAGLRARLFQVVDAGPIEALPLVHQGRALQLVPAAVPALQIPPDWTIDPRRREGADRRRARRVALLWTTSGVAMLASAAFGFWLGQARTAEPGDQLADARTRASAVIVEPSQPAEMLPPPLAPKLAPALTQAAAAPGVPAVPTPALAKSTAPTAVAARPEPETLAEAEPQLPIPPVPARMAEAHRAARPRVTARARAPGSGEEDRPTPYYSAEQAALDETLRRGRMRIARERMGEDDDRYGRPYAGPASRGARYDPPADGDYIGTFSTGPYGARVFRYGP